MHFAELDECMAELIVEEHDQIVLWIILLGTCKKIFYLMMHGTPDPNNECIDQTFEVNLVILIQAQSGNNLCCVRM
jgi:hypothetical protein